MVMFSSLPAKDPKKINHTIEETVARVRERTRRLNLVAMAKYHREADTIDKHSSNYCDRMAQTMNQLRRRANNLKAYRTVLNENYSVDTFRSLEADFDPRKYRAATGKTMRHLAIERKIYCGGYDMRFFKYEIDRELRNQELTTQINRKKAKLLEVLEEKSSYIVNRQKKPSAFFRDIKQHLGNERVTMRTPFHFNDGQNPFEIRDKAGEIAAKLLADPEKSKTRLAIDTTS